MQSNAQVCLLLNSINIEVNDAMFELLMDYFCFVLWGKLIK